ncbi:MAG: hypothetical protein SPJ16_02735 [Helicobacter sp.]|uniref:hypothetical protein n=1 Tax=Helicobacter sp. TaxID=218 RepID=UPI002A90DD56|nr:hypothetical protein [Helicobacter sp.]MDY5950098.1 hypothetical protein [Helicobacter sp.]
MRLCGTLWFYTALAYYWIRINSRLPFISIIFSLFLFLILYYPFMFRAFDFTFFDIGIAYL